MSEEHIIGAVQKNVNHQFRVSIKDWDGRKYINIRLWYRNDGEDDYRFTSKGVALLPTQARELCGIMRKLEQELDQMEGDRDGEG